MSNPTGQLFQSFWLGAISPYEAMCMRSFLDHGHAFDLYTYTFDIDVPQGVRLRDAAEILDNSEYFTYKSGSGKGSHSAFSNLFRYKLLYERGGWWVDTDVICLTKNIGHYDQFFARESPDIVNGAVLRFEPRDPFLLSCLEETVKIRSRARWGEIGPRLITELLKQHGRFESAQPESTCYPVHHNEAMELLRPESSGALSDRIKPSILLHVWNEVLRRHKIDKTLLPPSGSILRQFFEHHAVMGWNGEYDHDALKDNFDSVETDASRAHREKSVMLINEGRREDAIDEMRRAIACAPKNSKYYYELGKLLLRSGRLHEAEAAQRTVIELNSDHARAYRQLSAIHKRKGRHNEAIAAARRAVELNPDDTKLHDHLMKLIGNNRRQHK